MTHQCPEPEFKVTCVPIGEGLWSVECSEHGAIAITDKKEAEPQGMLHLMNVHGAKYEDIVKEIQ